MCVYIYIYIYRERERYTYVYIYIYIYIYRGGARGAGRDTSESAGPMKQMSILPSRTQGLKRQKDVGPQANS